MDSLCLTGQGKGRLEYGRRRHVFNYESLWEPNKSQWSLALSLPLIGQELIRFDFGENRKKVSGNFALRLKKEKVDQSTNGLLERFYAKLTEWLVINKERKLSGKFSNWNISLDEGNLLAITKVDNKHLFELKAFSWDDHYERMTLSLLKSRGAAKRQNVLRLELFVSACNLD